MEPKSFEMLDGAKVEDNLLMDTTTTVALPLSYPPAISPKSAQKQATFKRIAQGLEIVLITENVNQLKFIVQTNGHHPFYSLIIVLICASISLQVAIGLSILCIGPLSINKKAHRSRTKLLNVTIHTFIFLVLVINIFISSLVVEHGPAPVVVAGDHNKLTEDFVPVNNNGKDEGGDGSKFNLTEAKTEALKRLICT